MTTIKVTAKGDDDAIGDFDATLVEDVDYQVPKEPLPTLAYLIAHGYVKEV